MTNKTEFWQRKNGKKKQIRCSLYINSDEINNEVVNKSILKADKFLSIPFYVESENVWKVKLASRC